MIRGAVLFGGAGLLLPACVEPPAQIDPSLGRADADALGSGQDSSTPDVSDAQCAWTAPEGGIALFAFDEAGSEDDWLVGVLPPPFVNAPAVVARSPSVGHACPGALQFTASFLRNDGRAALLEHQLGNTPDAGAQDWRGRRKLHYWIKLQTAAGGAVAYLQLIQAFVQSGDPSEPAGWDNFYASTGVYAPDITFSDALWHEMAVDLTVGLPSEAGMEGLNLIDVNMIGVQIDNSSGDASSTPNTTVLYVDDIWLE